MNIDGNATISTEHVVSQSDSADLSESKSTEEGNPHLPSALRDLSQEDSTSSENPRASKEEGSSKDLNASETNPGPPSGGTEPTSEPSNLPAVYTKCFQDMNLPISIADVQDHCQGKSSHQIKQLWSEYRKAPKQSRVMIFRHPGPCTRPGCRGQRRTAEHVIPTDQFILWCEEELTKRNVSHFNAIPRR